MTLARSINSERILAGGPARADARGLAWKVLGISETDVMSIAEVSEPALVPLRPGEETTIDVVVSGLLPSADFQGITATLRIEPVVQAPPPESSTVTVTIGAGPPQTIGTRVDAAVLPKNVQVRLAGGEVIWSHAPQLLAGEYTIPDFAAAANRYLDALSTPSGDEPMPVPASGGLVLRFLVQSDTAGRASIRIDRPVNYALLQTNLWPNDLDGTDRIDRNLPVTFGDATALPLDPPGNEIAAARLPLRRITLEVSGDVGPERLLGDAPPPAAGESATVSVDYAVGQEVRLEGTPIADVFRPGVPIRVAGVAGILTPDGETEIYVALQRDAGGVPGLDAPLGSATLTLGAPPTGAPAPWTYAAFDAPADLALDQGAWIVIKGIRGRARLATSTAGSDTYLGRTLINRGGRVWRPLRAARQIERDPAGARTALVRLIYLPDPDTGSAAIEIATAGSPPQRVDPTASSQTLTLDIAEGTPGASALNVTSFATGEVVLANVIQRFGGQ